MAEQQPPSYESATQNIVNELARDVRPNRMTLDLRKIKKHKERTVLIFKSKQQTEKMRRIAMDLRSTESQLQAVDSELQQIEGDLLIACDAVNV